MILRHDPLDHPEELIRRVYAYVAYWLGDGADAEDATSEVFENALRYKASYDPRKGEPLAWLLGIARRAVRAALARRPTPAAEPPEPAAREDLESETIQRLSLDAAVAGLGDRERELIALRYGADLAAKQIAELLGMSTNAVEVALHRTLTRLRKELEDPGEGRPRRAGDPAPSVSPP